MTASDDLELSSDNDSAASDLELERYCATNLANADLKGFDWKPTRMHALGEELAEIKMQTNGEGPVSCTLALSSGNTLLAVAINDAIYIYSTSTYQVVEAMYGNTKPITQVLFAPCLSHPSAYTVVSAADHIAVWSPDADGLLINPNGLPNGNIAQLRADFIDPLISHLVEKNGWEPGDSFLLGAKRAIRSSLDLTLRHHSMNMHPERIRLQGDFTSVSPDGKFLTCVTRSRGSLRLVRGSRVEDWIFVWDLELNRMRHQIPCEGPVWSVVVSPDSRTILACTKGGIARFWNAESGIFEHSLALSCDRALRGHYSPGVKHIAFICNEEEGKGTVHIYEVETKTVISVWEQPDIAINSVDWAPDRELLAIATSRGVCLWDPISQIEQTAWNVRVYDHDIEKPRFVSVLDVRFVDQGKKLIFNTARGMTEVYDFENNSGHRYGKMRRERKRGRSKLCTSISAPKVFVRDDNVACSKDSTFFVTVDKRELLRIWSLRGATDDRDDIT